MIYLQILKIFLAIEISDESTQMTQAPDELMREITDCCCSNLNTFSDLFLFFSPSHQPTSCPPGLLPVGHFQPHVPHRVHSVSLVRYSCGLLQRSAVSGSTCLAAGDVQIRIV